MRLPHLWIVLPLLLAGATALGTPTGRKWTTLPPGYRVFAHGSINGVSSFSTAVLPKVQGAFATWTRANVGCTLWDISYLGTFSTPTGTAAVASDGQNRVLWQTGSSWRYGGSVLGLTTTVYIPTTGQITDGDMELNNNVPWSVTGASNAFDAQSVVLHEAGHLLGLDHTNDLGAVMYPSIAQGQVKAALGTADLGDVCTVYPSTAGALASITLSPNPASLAIGGAQQFTATGRDSGGMVVPVTPGWSVTGGGGTISPGGLFTAGSAQGTFTNTVRAASGAIFGTATVVISAGSVATITVTPGASSLAVGGSQQFTAVGRDSGGNVVPFTPVWAVAAGGGTISSSGIFTAGTAAGTFPNTVTASSGGVSGSASVGVSAGPLALITVSPGSGTVGVGGTLQFAATGSDAFGNPVAVSPAWSVASGGGSVSATGLFTAGTVAGSFSQTVRATSGTLSGTASVIVSPGPLATITLSPLSSSLAIGASQPFTAAGRDSYGNPVAISPAWAVASGGGTIDAAGLFVGGSTTGTFVDTVRATSGGVSGRATVTVTAGALAAVTVSPNPASVPTNGTVQFTAVGRDSGGNPVAITPGWSVIAGGGTISASGLFTAGTATGTFSNTIRATSGSVVAFASVNVSAGPLASLTVIPNTASLAAGATIQLTASGQDAAGNNVFVTPAWAVVNGGGTISAGGFFTAGPAAGTFTNTVRATSGTVTGYATLTVNAGAVASITVGPSPASVPVGATVQFTATGRDATGNVVPVTPGWGVTAGGGTISTAGLFTAGSSPGTFPNTVTASNGAVSGSATVTVTAGTLASLTLAPSPASVPVGGTVQFTATGIDSGGNPIAVTPSWSVVSGGGTISAGGLFTAGSTPGTFSNTVRAGSGTVSASATVTVTVGPLASLTLAPIPASLPINGTVQFTASGRDAAGNPVAVTPSWSVVNGGGTISAGGLFTAGVLPGAFANTVVAGSGGVSATASVTVNPGPLAAIEVSPSPASVQRSGAIQFTAQGRDVAGNPVPAAVVWSVVSGGGTIDATGRFTAGATVGTFTGTVVATSGSVSGSSTVSVTLGALASLTISPNPAVVVAGATAQLAASGADAAGNPVQVATSWMVVNGGGTVSPAGLFTAGAAAGSFPDTIRAANGAISALATIQVQAGALARVEVTPSSVQLAPGGQQQFTAAASDAFGNPVPGAFSWEVAAPAAGTISSTGLFLAGSGAGAWPDAVRASVGAVSGRASVSVVDTPVARVELAPLAPTVAMDQKASFAARAFDAAGRELLGQPVAWGASAGGTIDALGGFTAGRVEGEFPDAVSATIGGITTRTAVRVPADFDQDGLADRWELEHGLDNTRAADASEDPDQDLLVNAGEQQARSDPRDADSDDDGVLDGSEAQPGADTDQDGLSNANDPDSDGDGLLDGIEHGVSSAGPATELAAGRFQPDADPATRTNPLARDTDADTLEDAAEDANHNGRVDPGETDPNVADKPCVGPACEPARACGCSTGFGEGALFGILAGLLALARRRRPEVPSPPTRSTPAPRPAWSR